MSVTADSVLALAESTGDFFASAGRRFDVLLLAAGLALHLVADVVRNGGWHGVLRAADPAHRPLRLRDVQAAAFAGGGVNSVVPARAGDLVKLALIRRRVPAARMPTLAATFVPETLFETLAGVLLLTWAVAGGYVPVDVAVAQAGGHPAAAAAIGAGAAALIAAAGVLLRRRARRLYGDLVAGFAILRRPRDFAVRVVSWQLAGRAIRLAAIACCLAACRLPGDAAAAALAMAVEGGTRVSFAPATAGLRVALLAYGLPAVTGTTVSLGAVVAYVAVVRSVRTVVSLAIAAVILAATFGTHSPRRALAALRRLRGAATEPLSGEPDALAAKAPAGSA
jgi:hypothetical protein